MTLFKKSPSIQLVSRYGARWQNALEARVVPPYCDRIAWCNLVIRNGVGDGRLGVSESASSENVKRKGRSVVRARARPPCAVKVNCDDQETLEAIRHARLLERRDWPKERSRGRAGRPRILASSPALYTHAAFSGIFGAGVDELAPSFVSWRLASGCWSMSTADVVARGAVVTVSGACCDDATAAVAHVKASQAANVTARILG